MIFNAYEKLLTGIFGIVKPNGDLLKSRTELRLTKGIIIAIHKKPC
jgi:hypothetical protein